MSHPSRRRPQNGDPLTGRELQILALVAAGEPTPAITRRLGIAESTVKTHLTSVYRKTGSLNRVQATRHYLERYVTAPHGAGPAHAEVPSLIREQIHEIQARLDHLAAATGEAARLRRALEALRAIEPL